MNIWRLSGLVLPTNDFGTTLYFLMSFWSRYIQIVERQETKTNCFVWFDSDFFQDVNYTFACIFCQQSSVTAMKGTCSFVVFGSLMNLNVIIVCCILSLFLLEQCYILNKLLIWLCKLYFLVETIHQTKEPRTTNDHLVSSIRDPEPLLQQTKPQGKWTILSRKYEKGRKLYSSVEQVDATIMTNHCRCKHIYLTITSLHHTKSFYETLIGKAFGKLCRANMTRSSIICEHQWKRILCLNLACLYTDPATLFVKNRFLHPSMSS